MAHFPAKSFYRELLQLDDLNLEELAERVKGQLRE